MVRDIYELYSLAAYEFPESAKWIPEWLTKHKSFQEIKGSRVFKIFSQFGLNDFRESFEDPSIVEDFKDWLISNLSTVVRSASIIKDPKSNASKGKDPTDAIQLEQVAYKLIHEIMKPGSWSSNKHRITSQVSSDDKKFRIDAGTSIIKAYNIIKMKVGKVGFSIPDVESSQEFKNYSQRGGFSVVFSTKPEDIMAMSSRSEWESCQTIDSDKGLNACLLGSTLSKFIGIVYITSGKLFKDRGEEMFARCLVRFAVDTTNRKPTIILDKMYPRFNQKFANGIQAALRKRTSIEVHDIEKLSPRDDFARFEIPKEKIKGINEHEKSYMDMPEVFTSDSDNIVGSPVKFIREYIEATSKWLGAKVAIFISRHKGTALAEEYRESVVMCQAIIAKITEIPSMAIARHYQRGGKPMSKRFVKKTFAEEMIKPMQKLRIRRALNEYLSTLEKNYNVNYLPSIELRNALIDFIFNQMANLPEENVI